MIATETRTRFDDARRAMIDSQLRTSGVNEPFVLARMSVVPREDFVPESQRAAAYADRAVRLPDGGALPAPVVSGMLLAEARPAAATACSWSMAAALSAPCSSRWLTRGGGSPMKRLAGRIKGSLRWC